MPSIAQPKDTDFEITFGDLAHAQLRDKAPALLDYLLGFQVIDQNEDQTHGVGVMGFKLGEQMLFVPSFFLNGELKQNLIYLKNQDLFVPLQDNWVQYLLNRRPAVMGSPEVRKEHELGIQQPDLSGLTNSRAGGDQSASIFGLKNASHRQGWCAGCEQMFARLDGRYERLPTLPQFLKKTAEYGTSRILARTMRDDHNFANVVLTQYPLEQLLHKSSSEAGEWFDKYHPTASRKKKRKLVRSRGGAYPNRQMTAKSATEESWRSGRARRGPMSRRMSGSMKSAGVLFDFDQIIEDSGPHKVSLLHDSFAALLSDSELQKLASGHVVVRDIRKDANEAYKSDVNPSLQNPTECGSHRMLLADGKYKDVCIGIGPKSIGKGFMRAAIVVDKEGGNYGYWWPEHIWVQPKDDVHEDNGDYYDGLKDLSSVEVGKTYAIMTKSRQMSVAFTVRRKDSNSDGATELYVDPKVSDPGSKPTGTVPYNDEQAAQFGEGPNLPFVGEVTSEEDDRDMTPSGKTPFSSLSHIVLTDDDREMRTIRNTLFVPKNAKVFSLSDGKSLESWAMADPSSLIDMELNILKSGDYEEMELLKKAEGIYVGSHGPLSSRDLMLFLLKDAGLREKQASDVIASLPMGKRTRFFVKNNIGFAPNFPEPEYGYDDYSGVQEQFPQDDDMPVDMPMPPPDAYLGKLERQQINEAVATGQKDVFDTSAIASLVRTADSQDLITQYLSDIILGLDRINRVMFMFYWLNEQFRDRYGQENLVELEDQLKNVSKSVGDLVLFLKQRQVEGSPSFDSMEINLGVK